MPYAKPRDLHITSAAAGLAPQTVPKPASVLICTSPTLLRPPATSTKRTSTLQKMHNGSVTKKSWVAHKRCMFWKQRSANNSRMRRDAFLHSACTKSCNNHSQFDPEHTHMYDIPSALEMCQETAQLGMQVFPI